MREGAAQNGSEIGAHIMQKSFAATQAKSAGQLRRNERVRESGSAKTVAYNQARVVINQIVGGVMSLSACRATSDVARSSFDFARL